MALLWPPKKKNQNYSLNLKPTKETFSISITRISVGPLHLRFTYGDDNLKKMYLAKFFYKFSFHLAAFFLSCICDEAAGYKEIIDIEKRVFQPKWD